MSLSSIKAALGVGVQAARGTPAASFIYVPVLNANMMGDQLSQTIPPEVGGAYYSRGAYKAGIRSRGDVALIPRADSIGWFIRSLFHLETVQASGAQHVHTFTGGDAAATPPMWLTARRMVGNLYGEQMTDVRVGAFRLDVAAANVVNASVQMIGGNHEEIPGEDIYVPDGDFFVTCVSSVTEGGVEMIVDRLSIEIGAQLTDNEFRIGSYYLDDITQLQRMAQITADVRVKSRDYFGKVYRANAAAPTAGTTGAWSPVIYRAGLRSILRTGSATPEVIDINFPALDFLTFPVQITGAELVRAQLSAAVTLDTDNYTTTTETNQASVQPITLKLLNGRSTVYA